MKRKLGRLTDPDPRDHAFLMAPRRSSLTSRLWAAGNPDAFDQGDKPWCVSYAANRYLVASPIRNRMPESFEDFYRECQAVDGIRGRHEGSTVRAAMKVLQAKGLIDGYQWAFDVERVVNQVLTVGPVDAGTDWTNDMFEPFKLPGRNKGFIQVGQKYDVAGGHSYLFRGVERNKRCPDNSVGALRIAQTWGSGFGIKGDVWLSFRDFGILLNHQGEAAVATEVKGK